METTIPRLGHRGRSPIVLMKPKLRLTIRATLLLMTLIAILFAVFMGRLRARRAALHTIRSVGGSCSVSATSEPEWLRNFFNEDEYFREIGRVNLGPNNQTSDAKRPAGDAELRAVIASLPDPGKLKHLNLYKSLVSDDGLSCLQALSNLEALELRNTLVTDAGLQRIASCNQLRTLDLASTAISDRGLPSLVRLQRLESLNLGDTSVTENGLKHLTRLQSLKRLDLDGTSFLGGGLVYLKELPNLETLILDDTTFGSRGGAAYYLPRYADKFLSLRVLSLEDVPISDSDLQYLQQFPSLEKLMLDGTAVTDGGLSHFKTMTNLTEVSLKKTEVTSEGVTALQRMLPLCTISTK